MSSKREILANSLDNLGMLNLLSKINRPMLVVLNYHRLYRGLITTEFDEGTFDHSEDVFVQQLRWLQDRFDLIDENTLIEKVQNQQSFRRRTALLTFDDGYRDNYELAYPILSEMNIPATFFIPCDQLNGLAFAWWDQIAFMVKNSRNSSISFNGQTFASGEALSSEGDSVASVLATVKSIPTVDMADTLNAISEACCVPVPEGENIQSEFMTWDQIREVNRNGISIGSHSMSHQILSHLSEDQQRWELEESKRVLESETGRPINTVAYPVGGKPHFNRATLQIAEECGYKLGFSYIKGYYRSPVANRFEICRNTADPLAAIFKAQAMLPGVFINH